MPAACGPQPEGARSSACLANRNRFMIDRRIARQNVKLFLREPYDSKARKNTKPHSPAEDA